MQSKTKGRLEGPELRMALNSITEDEWEKIYTKLRNMTEGHIRKRYSLVKYMLVSEELVNESVTRVLEGKTNWDGKDLDTLSWEIWNIIKRNIGETIRREIIRTKVHEKHVSRYPPENIEHSDLLRDLLQIFDGDEQVVEIILYLSMDPSLKPRDIAELMNSPISIIYNAYKRLRRRLDKLHEFLF